MPLLTYEPGAQLAELQPELSPWQVWRHHSGRVYVVISLTNKHGHRDTKYPPGVFYMNLENKETYQAVLDDWHRRMVLEGKLAGDSVLKGEILHTLAMS